MHASTCLSGWSSALLHKNIVAAYELPQYTINQLRYDLRKMKAHGLVERDGKHYSYRLTEKGVKVAAMFVLFHKRVCGPLANSLFHHRPDKFHLIDSTLEKAYHRADDSIETIVALLAA
jgi:DNA-binding PadR family transcriptional regulator